MPFNLQFEYFSLVGVVLLALLLSFALVDRINVLKQETEVAHLDALKISPEKPQLITHFTHHPANLNRRLRRLRRLRRFSPTAQTAVPKWV